MFTHFIADVIDINECKESSTNDCVQKCDNTDGGFVCSCDNKFQGDGKIDGTGCAGDQLA